MFKPTAILRGLFLSCCMLFGAASHAYPDKPVRIISPFSAGGTNDYLARLSGSILTEKLGASFVVEQRLGAGGMIGADVVAKAKPDGQTLLMGSISTHAVAPFVYGKLPFDYENAFTPVTVVATVPLVLVAHPGVPAEDVPSLLALLKGNPGKYTYGTSGNGTVPHLGGELFRHLTGVDIVHVPYRGDANAVNDLLGGQIDLMFANLPSVISHIKAGTLRAYAVSGTRRSLSLPNLPTVTEAGVPGFEVDAWYAIFGPAGMDPAISRKLASTLAQGLKTEQAQRQLLGQGADAVGSSPEEFAAFLKAEQVKWSQVIEQAGISVQ